MTRNVTDHIYKHGGCNEMGVDRLSRADMFIEEVSVVCVCVVFSIQ